MSFGKCQECKEYFTLEEYNSACGRRPTGNEPSLCFNCLYRRAEAYVPWVLVSERLPESKYTYCHLYIPSVNKNSPFKGWYQVDKKVWLTTLKSHQRTNKVTHWKPIVLPEQALEAKPNE